MSVPVENSLSLTDFIKQNKAKIYETARNSAKLNQDNKPSIAKNDDWFNEDVWDEHFNRINNQK